MKNKELAQIFYEIAGYLEMEKVAFKPYAYEKAALALEGLEQDIEDVYNKGGQKALQGLPGVGKSIALKIEEYLNTGRIRYHGELKKKTPINLGDLLSVEGLGPKKAKILYQKLGIRTLKDLEKAAVSHQIASLFGFGEKTEKNILEAIAFLKRNKGRFLLGEILPKAREIEQILKEQREVKQISLAGSLRRRKETIADIDILVISSKPDKIMDFFVSLPGIVKVWSKGKTRSSIRLKDGFDVDLRIVPEKSYGSALQYFTGSKEHNIATRLLAIDKGLKLNEYGVFRGKNRVAGKTEDEVYKAIGLDRIPPELRENQGELKMALHGELPELLGYEDIRGDLHCHSDWDGGANSIETMMLGAMSLGYEYLGISDHTKFLRIEHGLDENDLAEQRKEIDKLNVKSKCQMPAPHRTESSCIGISINSDTKEGGRGNLGFPVAERLKPRGFKNIARERSERLCSGAGSNVKFRILQGAETNILNDGSIDIRDEALRKLDYAIAGVHSNFKLPRNQMTERIIRAMKNPYVKIISHPTGRLLKRRDEYQIDFAQILRAAKETRTLLEINSFPERLDLNDQNIKRAKEAGVKMIINTDAHQKEHLKFIELGISQARRGWAEKKDIVNTQPLEKLLEYLIV